jgi:hypothetical protein
LKKKKSIIVGDKRNILKLVLTLNKISPIIHSMVEIKEYQFDVRTVANGMDKYAIGIGMDRELEPYRTGDKKVRADEGDPSLTSLELLDTVIAHAQKYTESGDTVTSTIATLIVNGDRAISQLTGLEHRFLMDGAISFSISEKTKELEYDEALNLYFSGRDVYLPALNTNRTEGLKREIGSLKNHRDMLRATAPTVNKERAS